MPPRSASPGDLRQRRARLVSRHHLDGGAADPVSAARSVVVVHATDPATVYLSLLARCQEATLDDIAAALYDERSLVRLLAMRRTLFVVPCELAPVVHHAASAQVATTVRARLLTQLARLPTEPELPEGEELETWLSDVETSTVTVLATMGRATGVQLSQAEPRLRTAVLPSSDKKYDVRRTLTTSVLALLGAEGRIVRARPLGSWTSRQHTWEPASAWWPDGIPALDPEAARASLVQSYLRRFGPATPVDVAWWTGWSQAMTRRALAALETVDTGAGLVLTEDAEPVQEQPPHAALLPSLDSTPMGWKERDWFLPEDHGALYDRNGNIGPTLWWGGEVVGGWAVRKDGTIATELIVDRGREAAQAVEAAAARLGARLEGSVVVPSFRTPLERSLSGA